MANALIEDLKWRGLIYQQTDEEGIEELLNKEQVTYIAAQIQLIVYILVTCYLFNIKTLPRTWASSYRLNGGGTGMIGDLESLKSVLQTESQVEANVKGLSNQMHRLFEFGSDKGKIS